VAQKQQVLNVSEVKLGNGMTVWLNEDHSQPKVYGAVVVKAGAVDCPNTGIAHYFEHIMFKGTDRIGTTNYAAEKVYLDSIAAQYELLAQTTDDLKRKEIQKRINQLSIKAGDYAIPNEFNRLIAEYGGTDLNAGTSYDYTFYHNVFSPQYMRQWLTLNSHRLLHPVYRLFQGELETVYEEKNRSSDNIIMGALEKGLSEMFKGTPYEYPIIGSTENLKNPRMSEMEAFYKKFYVPSNMGLVPCGDFDSEAVKGMLEETFGRLPKADAPRRDIVKASKLTGQRTVKLKIPLPLIKATALAFRAPADFEADAPALDLATKLLSNDGETGLLDSLSNNHKILAGLSGRMSLNGIGTLTFCDPDSGVFGALGHSINDSETGLAVPLREGSVTEAQIVSVHPGTAGTPGELDGISDLSQVLGSVERNTDVGIFGHISAALGTRPARIGELRAGPASILSTVEGRETGEFQVEINRVYRDADGTHAMFSVTDPALLSRTGGIVQGMSGSPILQNGCLVGAVTHVFINDASRGYAVSIQDMLRAAGLAMDKAA
jgi:predicted Zn-dependent peptidase